MQSGTARYRCAFLQPALVPAQSQHQGISLSQADALGFLSGFQVLGEHALTGFEPVDAAHLGDVEHDAPGDDAVFGRIDVQHGCFGLAAHVSGVEAVVEFAIPSLVAQGVQMGDG